MDDDRYDTRPFIKALTKYYYGQPYESIFDYKKWPKKPKPDVTLGPTWHFGPSREPGYMRIQCGDDGPETMVSFKDMREWIERWEKL